MFEEVVDLLMVQWYNLYEQHKEKIEEDDDFNQSRERKKMNKFIDAIVILYSNQRGRP